MNFIFGAAAGTLAGAAAAMGLGGGSVLLLYLTLIAGLPQLSAQGINLIFFIPCALVSLVIHRKGKLVKYKTALICGSAGLAGTVLGVLLAGFLSGSTLRKVFAVFLFLVGIRELIKAFTKK